MDARNEIIRKINNIHCNFSSPYVVNGKKCTIKLDFESAQHANDFLSVVYDIKFCFRQHRSIFIENKSIVDARRQIYVCQKWESLVIKKMANEFNLLPNNKNILLYLETRLHEKNECNGFKLFSIFKWSKSEKIKSALLYLLQKRLSPALNEKNSRLFQATNWDLQDEKKESSSEMKRRG